MNVPKKNIHDATSSSVERWYQVNSGRMACSLYREKDEGMGERMDV